MITVKKLTDGSESWKKINGVFLKNSVEIKYLVTGASSISDAIDAVVQEAPSGCGAATLNEIKFDSFLGDSVGSGMNIVASYSYSSSSSSSSDNDADDDPTMSFDCGGGTKHITHSIHQRRVKGNRDPKGAVGWDGEKTISGVDVPTAQLRETYTKTMKLSQITNKFKRNVASLVGKVNSSNFKGWNAGEVMFLGMSYSTPTKGVNKVTVTFNFAIQVNENGVKIGDTSVSKKGYEYVWAINSTSVEGDSLANNVSDIFVDQVCEYDSFACLGL